MRVLPYGQRSPDAGCCGYILLRWMAACCVCGDGSMDRWMDAFHVPSAPFVILSFGIEKRERAHCSGCRPLLNGVLSHVTLIVLALAHWLFFLGRPNRTLHPRTNTYSHTSTVVYLIDPAMSLITRPNPVPRLQRLYQVTGSLQRGRKKQTCSLLKLPS